MKLNIQKTAISIAANTKNSNCYSYKYKKEIFCSISGGYFMELRVKELYVFNSK